MTFPNGSESNENESIETPDAKSKTVRERLVEEGRRVQEALTEHDKTYGDPSGLSNASSPTNIGSPSTQESLMVSTGTLSMTDANPDYSSTSENSESEQSSPSSVITLGLSRERAREMTLTVHFSTFGKTDQALKSAMWALRELSVSGLNIVQATCGGDFEGEFCEFEPNNEQHGTWKVMGSDLADPYKL